jgi:copper chaperone CopZ
MIQTTVKVEGMMCGMCEAHVNDAVRKAIPVKKVTSSRGKKETVILSDGFLDHEAVKRTIADAGYTPLSIAEETAEKKGFFHFGRG